MQVRRLFSTFARGWPGVGLFLMRIVVGGSLIVDGIGKFQTGHTMESAILGLLVIGNGALLVVGLWTPIAGSLTVVHSAWKILIQHYYPYPEILLAAMGAALVLVGPGAVSLDAWLFGWKRIDLDE